MLSETEKLKKRITEKNLLLEIYNADDLVRKQKYEDARKIYSKLLKQIPKCYEFDICETYRKLGDCAWYLKDNKNAIINYEKTLSYCTTNVSVYKMLSFLEAKLDCEKTLNYYFKCIELGEDESYFTIAAWLMMKESKFSQEFLKNTFERYVDYYREKFLKIMPAFTHEKRNPSKKINIGYVSTDFYCHAMMSFILPLLENHNLRKFNFTLYSLTDQNDAVTARIKKTGMKFVDCGKMNVQEIAKQIYNDKIDIIVDLAGYINKKAFWLIYKPAPIQMQYLGFLNTYGMKEVDYIIADEYSIPKEITKFYTEKPLYLKSGMQKYCFSYPGTVVPACSIEPPILKNGYVTFGSFNTVNKIDEYTISLWVTLINSIENSRLLFYRTQMDSEDKERIIKLLEKYNADMTRISFQNENINPHFKIYELADIALDPVPFSGLTVTIETILMGVPVLCMPKDTLQSKGTARINNILGLEELVGNDENDFISKAKSIANKDKITFYRENLRYKLMTSPLFNNYKELSKDFEDCFEYAFAEYCKTQN